MREIGDAWHEDVVQGLRRYRVPLVFENGQLDLQVTIDPRGKVAGVFMLPHRDAPAEATGRAIEIVVGDEARGLPGVLTLPEGSGPFPGVVLVHGSGPNDRDESTGPNRPFRELATGFGRLGIAVLRYDKRSFAHPSDLEALGAGLTVREEVIDDAVLALRLLRERPEIDRNKVFVLGHSLGGTLAPRIAAAEPRPAGMIVLAGMATPFPEKLREQARYIARAEEEPSDEEAAALERVEADLVALRAMLDGEQPPAALDSLGVSVGYFADLERHDPPAEAVDLGLPILVLQGRRDFQVTMQDFGNWEAALAGKPFACLVVYDELDHLFHRGTGPSRPQDYLRAAPVDARVIADASAWIHRRQCPVAPADVSTP